MAGKAILAAVTMAAFLAPAVASACECAIPREREALRAYIIENSRHVFAGRVLWLRKRSSGKRDDPTPLIEARVRVLRQIKGTLPKDITVVSRGGDTGANCGFGDGLASAWASELPVTLALDEAEMKNGKAFYVALGCTSGRFHIDPSE